MTTTAQMIDTALWAGLVLIAFAGFVWVGDRLMDRKVPGPPRPDRRLPERDYALLGTDWRESVAPYFHRELERSNRRRMAVISACGTDPEQSETRDVRSSGSLDQRR